MKCSWKGLKDRNRQKNRIKRSGLARLVYVRHKPWHPYQMQVSPRGTGNMVDQHSVTRQQEHYITRCDQKAKSFNQSQFLAVWLDNVIQSHGATRQKSSMLDICDQTTKSVANSVTKQHGHSLAQCDQITRSFTRTTWPDKVIDSHNVIRKQSHSNAQCDQTTK